MTRALIVPAAGLGSRLGSAGPKLLHPVAGRPMIDHLLDLYAPVVDHVVVVVSPAAREQVEAHLARRGEGVAIDEQVTPTGMLDAILIPEPRLRSLQASQIWITWCDQVGILPDTVARVKDLADMRPDAAMVMPTSTGPHPYVHLDRAGDGSITRIRHRREGDAMPDVGESDAGLFVLSGQAYHRELTSYAARRETGAQTGERNFVPFIPWMAARAPVLTVSCHDPREAVGINTPAELGLIEGWLQERRRRSQPGESVPHD